MEGFYSVSDVCRLLRVSRETIRRWEKQGEFPRRVCFTRNPRGRVGFRIEDVNDWSSSR
jgi:excisionase family DNA binding protein